VVAKVRKEIPDRFELLLKMSLYGCDTWVAMKDITETGTVILAKNSDRPLDDCQPLVYQPKKTWPEGNTLKLEYREIPQTKVTYATLGSSPYWCWGYEEGVNEYGVAVGNEAVYTKSLKELKAAEKKGVREELGLLGMDLLRLGLERGKTAHEVLEVITNLVAEYGQWGAGFPGVSHYKGSYDNSFLIADAKEAWILETVGRRWIARKIDYGYGAISNGLGIGTKWDLASADIIDYALEKGWCPTARRESFNFARAYGDRKEKLLNLAGWRAKTTAGSLEKKKEISVTSMMQIAKVHFPPICMHKLPSGTGSVRTASSIIAILPASDDKLVQFWWTPGPPCRGIYVPFFIDGNKIPEIVSRAGKAGKSVTPAPDAKKDEFSDESYWWLLRKLFDNAKRKKETRKTFAHMQEKWLNEVGDIEKEAISLKKDGKKEECADILSNFTSRCITEVLAII
jgi:secernin